MTVEIKREDAINLLSQRNVLNSDGEECLLYPGADKYDNEKLADILKEIPEFDGIEEDTELEDTDAMATLSLVFQAFNDEELIEVVGSDFGAEPDEKPARKPKKGKKKVTSVKEEPAKPSKAKAVKTATDKPSKAKPAKPVKEKAAKQKQNIVKEKSAKKISLIDAAANILAETRTAMSCKEIVAVLEKRKLWSTMAATPDRTLSTAIIHEMRGDTGHKKPRFVRVARGLFTTPGVKYTPPVEESPAKKAVKAKESQTKAKPAKKAKPTKKAGKAIGSKMKTK